MSLLKNEQKSQRMTTSDQKNGFIKLYFITPCTGHGDEWELVLGG